MRGLEDARIVDPSLVRHGDHYYLFGGHPQTAAAMLNVYVADAKGPHTVDARNGKAVLDYYVEKLSLLAGYRRLAAVVHSRLR